MKLLWIVALVIALLLMGCSGIPKPKYHIVQTLVFPDSTSAEKSINGITVMITPMDVSKELHNPKYNKKFNVLYTPYFNPIWEKFDRHINLFSGITPFEVTITNSTDQILKMEETRIMYIDPITDSPTEPYMALEFGTIMQNPGTLPVYNQIIDSFSKLNPQNADFLMQVGNEVRGLVQQLKFVNLPTREIMPKMKFTGIILIPIPREKITEGRMSFIDLVPKSAVAGYAEEKVRLDFTVKNVAKYWKHDKALGTAWIEISADEYNLNTQKK